ncbi:MAG: NAD-dependent epimerase [Myxococcales bacterium]|nr:NAD-dependent epimerase [Myxococcales bacterium]
MAPKKKNAAADDRKRILITGVSGRLGRELSRQLHRNYRVIGIDRRPADDLPVDVEHHRLDLRRNRTRTIFRQAPISAVVHLGTIYNPRRDPVSDHRTNIVGLQRLLDYVRTYNIPKLIVLSTADVYGPQAENITFLDEDAPLLAAARFVAIRDLVSVDMAAMSFMWKHPDTETVVLRPVHIVGDVRNTAMKYLSRQWVPSVLGFDPMVQLVHQDDVVRAIVLALEEGVRGVYNLDGPTAVPASVILKKIGAKQVPMPSSVLRFGLKQLWRFRLTRFPPAEVDHIQWPATVDGSKARRELGYAPAHDMNAILQMLRESSEGIR